MATNNYHKSKDDKEYFSVYTLSCPITKQVKYVGKTNNLLLRYRSHCFNPASTLLRHWIETLSIINEFPIMTEIKRADNNTDALLLEKEAILFYSQDTKLLNVRENENANTKHPYPINFLQDENN